MKHFRETSIPGVFEITMFNASDARGTFVKSYHHDTLEQMGLQSEFKESFYSTNHRGVIRGMHFQHPPHEHAKLVYCTSGRLIDVVVDLRIGSPTYGEHTTIELSADNFRAAYLPMGVAHGFEVLEDHTTMIYLCSSVHAPISDAGIRFDSFGHQWQTAAPIMSERDLAFPALSTFQSPFLFQ